MKIYTRTGDRGETTLFGGGRVRKDHPRVEVCGVIDELNAFLGSALTIAQVDRTQLWLSRIQHDLFSIGSHVASLPPAQTGRAGPKLPELPEGRPAEMESWIDEASEELPDLVAFILPGGTPGASALHQCRTVCRRAERAAAGVAAEDASVTFVVTYLNRLSDLLFMMARLENRCAGVEDVLWQKNETEQE